MSMTPSDDPHISVMLEEALDFLQPQKGGRYVDGTLGFGGHTMALLKADPSIEVIGIDRDAAALEAAGRRLAEFAPRVHTFHGSYVEMPEYVAELGWEQVDGVILDLGLSSMQLDTAERGFSFQQDGPLDMRFDRRNPVTASSLVNSLEEAELARLFREFGEESKARRIARAIVAHRADRPFSRTRELAEVIAKQAPPKPALRHQTLARCFQALRIAVNAELDHVSEGLEAALSVLGPGGRLVVISFQSLEDGIVKRLFRELGRTSIHDPTHPMGGYEVDPVVEVLTRKPLRPSAEELARNSRAAPARLRAAEMLVHPHALDPDDA